MRFPETLPIPAEVVEIARRLEEAGFETWCVGGALRDALLDLQHADFDLATAATPEVVQRLFRRTVDIGVKHGTVGVLDRAQRLHEVTTFRRDVSTDGRHAVVAFGVSLDDDLARRDFTINAVAYHPLRHDWRDPFGGRADLAAGVVRAVGRPADRFREDYLRILRALRFAARLDFTIDPATWQAAIELAPGLARLSAERVRDEWFKGLRTARELPRLVELWIASEAAAVWLPELAAPGRWYPEAVELRDPVLLTALLCRDPAGVLRRLKASNAEIGRAEAMMRAPATPADPSPPAVRRWLAATGPIADDLLALHRLRHGEPAPWESAARAAQADGVPLARGDLAVTGTDLRALGVPPGPALGQLLDRLLERVLDDPAANSRETLLAIAKELV